MTSITLTAPAKVNLFLKVLNKRRDGYHNILTLFERISLADKITISKIHRGIVVTSDKFITRNPKNNLAYKAAELILEYAGVKKGLKREDKGIKIRGMRGKTRGNRGVEIEGKKGVEIKIEKRIPIAAGLGGGSSDAASVLMGIDKLYNLKLKKSELVALGRKLGADVPFFLMNSPFAIGKGRGDELKKADIKAKLWHIIINPGFKLSTKDIYEAYDRGLILRRAQYQALSLSKGLTIKPPNVKISRYLKGSVNFKSPEEMLYNDLGQIAIVKKRVLGDIIERLASHLGRKSIVSGSGPSVFCLFRTGKEAYSAREKLFRDTPEKDRKLWQVFVASTVDSK